VKLLVTGGRGYDDKLFLYNYLDEFLLAQRNEGKEVQFLIHGDARGADLLAHGWAVVRSIQPVRVPALWTAYGQRAGRIRNANMLALCPDFLIAFPGGHGTAHMVSIAKRANVPMLIVKQEGQQHERI
jgi:hypothetical protein